MPLWVEVVGMVATVTSFGMNVPQATRLWRMRNDWRALEGVSIMTQTVLVMNAILWAIYAVALNAFWVGASSIINFPLALMAIIILLRARRHSDTVEA